MIKYICTIILFLGVGNVFATDVEIINNTKYELEITAYPGWEYYNIPGSGLGSVESGRTRVFDFYDYDGHGKIIVTACPPNGNCIGLEDFLSRRFNSPPYRWVISSPLAKW